METDFQKMMAEIVGDEQAEQIRRLAQSIEGAPALCKWLRKNWIAGWTDVFVEVSYPAETNSSHGPASLPYYQAINKLPEGRVLGEKHEPFGYNRKYGRTLRAYIFGSMPD